MKVITRQKAKESGLVRYFTGKPCGYGHIAERLTSCYICVICNQVRVESARQKNPDKHRQRTKLRARVRYHNDPEKARKHAKAQRDKSPERLRLNVIRRRARIAGAKGSHTVQDIENIFDKQNGQCVGIECNKSLKRGYHIDHKNPLSRGGSNYPRNLQLLCQPCNGSKNDKTMKEWRRSHDHT